MVVGSPVETPLQEPKRMPDPTTEVIEAPPEASPAIEEAPSSAEPELNPEDAQPIVQALIDLGMTPQEVSEGMDGRVSMRTIYRWMKGECLPQNMSNLQALIDLGLSKGVDIA